jgi:hypothetical protein
MQEQVKQSGSKYLPSIQELKDRLTETEPTSFARFRRTFFMCDLYSEHHDRFLVPYAP